MTALAGRYNTPALRAMAGHAHGAVLLAEGDARAAVVALRGAGQVGGSWRRRTRRRGLGCWSGSAAAMELDAARGVFARLGAAPDLARLATLDRREAASKEHGLTARQLEVLRLLAAGKTNRLL
jgi:DNA-binding NarL/FixJ family response regulator